ncbi:MAG: hypothetical protein HND53_06050 [Proteobacteria bacterium]|nr:hypothetical protein [Pseudomonadota bacterium]NOG60045.1 hypothetical protein [Pseudomonadota bacterium]
MRIQVLSDLHIEFGEFFVAETDADAVVFAGDIGVGIDGLKWIENQEISQPVIYVLGNHEFYNHDIDIVNNIKESAPGNIHVLNNDAVEIGDVRFLGCTLWTDFLLFGLTEQYFSVQNAKKNMADFEVIKNTGRRFSPDDSIRLHEQSRDWLEGMLSIPFYGETVVVTHHLPSSKSVPARFKKNLSSPAYASHLDDLISKERVDLWIHGHTHDSYDYEINGTRVVCNPGGYVGYELNKDFQAGLILEV